MSAAPHGVVSADGLSAPLTEAAVVVQCLRVVDAAAGRDQDSSSRRAGGAAAHDADHDVMQFGRRLRSNSFNGCQDLIARGRQNQGRATCPCQFCLLSWPVIVIAVVASSFKAGPQRGSRYATCWVVLSVGWCCSSDMGQVGAIIIISRVKRAIPSVGSCDDHVMKVFIAIGHNDFHKRDVIALCC